MRRRKTTKITIALLTILALATVLMVGCGNTKPETPSEKDESQAVIVEETETEEVTEVTEPTEIIEPETEEPTEVETEAVEPETEEEVIAIGYAIVIEGHPVVKEFPVAFDYGEKIGALNDGEKVYIIGEAYDEEYQLEYYRIRLENGKKGYVPKNDIRVEE